MWAFSGEQQGEFIFFLQEFRNETEWAEYVVTHPVEQNALECWQIVSTKFCNIWLNSAVSLLKWFSAVWASAICVPPILIKTRQTAGKMPGKKIK